MYVCRKNIRMYTSVDNIYECLSAYFYKSLTIFLYLLPALILDKKICRCNLSCRDGGHYHCPLCGKTIIRKSVMDLHLKSCTNTQDRPSTSAAVHTSNQNPITVKTATTSPAPTAPAPQASTVVSSSAVSAAQSKSTTGLKKENARTVN